MSKQELWSIQSLVFLPHSSEYSGFRSAPAFFRDEPESRRRPEEPPPLTKPNVKRDVVSIYDGTQNNRVPCAFPHPQTPTTPKASLPQLSSLYYICSLGPNELFPEIGFVCGLAGNLQSRRWWPGALYGQTVRCTHTKEQREEEGQEPKRWVKSSMSWESWSIQAEMKHVSKKELCKLLRTL